MNYIHRDLEEKILESSEDYACILVYGPSQAGKTTMLQRIMGSDREYVTLEDWDERRLAKEDPALFLQMHHIPLLIDEVQYAPELFSYIKIAVDRGAAPGSFWLVSSQAFRWMDPAQGTLAGRTAILHMLPLSQHEIYGSGNCIPFQVEFQALKARSQFGTPADRNEIYTRIWRGSLPGSICGNDPDRIVFFSEYLQTYIQRDVSERVNPSEKLIFLDFIRAAACRIGQMLNVHAIALEVGVSDRTAKRWLQILEKSDIVFFLRPYSNHLLKRTVKTPKLYFFDTGLVSYLTKYSSPEILRDGAINRAILENYVVLELIKSYHHAARECLLWYYRDQDSREIDLVMESDGQLHPMEIRRSVHPGSELMRTFSILDQGSVPRGKGALLCMRTELSAVNAENYIVPIWMI